MPAKHTEWVDNGPSMELGERAGARDIVGTSRHREVCALIQFTASRRFVLTRDFSDDVARLRAYNQRRLRLRAVPVSAIRGTVGRGDLLQSSRLREWTHTQRYRNILRAMSAGVSFPPVELYLLDGCYYIRDGHHRVAAACQIGILDLDAEVTECLPTTDSLAAAWHAERTAFERDTGLMDPHVRRSDGYALLRRQIAEHGWYLGERGQPPHSFAEAAARWEREIYRPVLALLDRFGMLTRLADHTPTELYLAVCDHKWYRSERLERDVGFPNAVAGYARLQRPGLLGRLLDCLEVVTASLHALTEIHFGLNLEG